MRHTHSLARACLLAGTMAGLLSGRDPLSTDVG